LLCFGEVVAIAMIGARKWHAEYVNVLIIIQTALTTQDGYPHSVSVPARRRYSYTGDIHTSRTSVLVQLGLTMTTLMVSFIFYRVYLCNWAFPAGVTLAVILFIVNILLSHFRLRRAEQAFWRDPKSSWCLAGIAFPASEHTSSHPAPQK
jgi:hypothetical protein